MKISWVLADSVLLDPTTNTAKLKEIGSIWGSWLTWRSCQTDNVICHDMSKADELIKREFYKNCNFYIPASMFTSLGQPAGVLCYQGDFKHDVPRQEEIVALHLAASTSDIVLLLGFDFAEFTKLEDRLEEHRATNYRNLIKQVIKNNPKTQWVLIDHANTIATFYQELDNLTQDTMGAVLSMF